MATHEGPAAYSPCNQRPRRRGFPRRFFRGPSGGSGGLQPLQPKAAQAGFYLFAMSCKVVLDGGLLVRSENAARL